MAGKFCRDDQQWSATEPALRKIQPGALNRVRQLTMIVWRSSRRRDERQRSIARKACLRQAKAVMKAA
jgi:hypothetical protein